MSMPKVSVIIPVYKVEKYIERCARSLFEQTLDDIEYLFIDDCTPDQSIEILKQVLDEYPQRKSQVVVHRMEKNSGQAAVRKWGMLNATGEYVIHCDSDDWVDIDMYRAMYEKALVDQADVVVCDFARVSDTPKTYICGCHSTEISEFTENCLFQRDSWSLCNKLFKIACYKDIIYPRGNMGEDMLIFFQLLSHCRMMAYIPEVKYFYWCNNESITKKNTVSNCKRNYEIMKGNVDTLIAIIDSGALNVSDKTASKSYLRFANVYHLLNALYLPECRKEWNKVCREISLFSFLFSKKIPKYYKMVYILVAFHIFPKESQWAENI